MASIRERVRKDGSVYHQVLWRDPDHRTQHSETFDVLTDAKIFQRALNANGQSFEMATSILASAQAQHTVAGVIREHIDMLMKPGERTIRAYNHMLEDHITDTIGGIAVAELDYRHLTHWVKTMQGKGLAPKTIRNIHGLISSAMNTAVRLKYRPDNPCLGIDLPSTESAHDKEQFLTWAEWSLIYRLLDPGCRPLALFLVMTGARIGEATAVTVADVQTFPLPATVRINKSWKRDGQNLYFVGAPKTATSKRTVAIPPPVTEALAPLMEGEPGNTLVFRTSMRGRLPTKHFYNAWMNAVRAAQVEDPTFTKTPRVHDLRHTSASWALQGGLTLYEVARRLGHASTNTTEKVYAHLMHEGMRKGADVMGRMLEG
jgi:integrase